MRRHFRPARHVRVFVCRLAGKGASNLAPRCRGIYPRRRLDANDFHYQRYVDCLERLAELAPEGTSRGMLEHVFHVRSGVLARVLLPDDITKPEVERLCKLLMGVPFS